jgi:hypothetical protein
MGLTIFLFLIPLAVWLIVAKAIFKHEFTLQEMGIQGGITAVALIALSFAGYHSQTRDYMLVNGVVTQLDPQRRNCPIGWQDFTDNFCTEYYTRTVQRGQTCTTNSQGVRMCTPNYVTQYNYIYPWEQRYFVRSTLRSFEIDRVDRQGSNTPPRFAQVNVGDPVSGMVAYTNYIQGAAHTLFNQQMEDVPPIAYPRIYDYYHVRRVIYYGTPSSSEFVESWNRDLAILNSAIAPTQANVIINVVGENQSWAEGLAQAWDAHNINDVVISIGLADERISWVDVRSWSSNHLVNITIRDEIMNLGVIEPERINAIIRQAIENYYEYQPMENFEYLADDIAPPIWVYILAGIILLIVTPAVTIYFSTPQESLYLRRNRYRRF